VNRLAASIVVLSWTRLLAAGCPTESVAGPTQEQAPGVVVEALDSRATAAQAGLDAGDILLRWELQPEIATNAPPPSGDLFLPLDVDRVKRDWSPKGRLALAAIRDGEAFKVVVAPGRWGLDVRPRLRASELTLYRSIIETAWRQAGPAMPAKGASRLLTADARRRDDPVRAAWFLRRSGDPESSPLSALRDLDLQRHTLVLELLADSMFEGGRPSAAKVLATSALRRQRAGSADDVAIASLLNKLGVYDYVGRDLESAVQLFRQAVAIRLRLAPLSLDLAKSLNNLGGMIQALGEFSRADACYRRSLQIKQRLVPDSLSVASSLNNLGNLARERGDLDAAETWYRRSLTIRERLAPESLHVATSLNNLGLVTFLRGDLATAEDRLERALGLWSALAPGSANEAHCLISLGNVASERGNLTVAESHYRRALQVQERLAPDGLEVAAILNNLGYVARYRDQLAQAEDLQRQALGIYDRLAPRSLLTAASLSNLGHVLADRGDTRAAAELFARALALRQRLAPNSLEVARSLDSQGGLAFERGDLPEARRLFQRALTLRQAIAPASFSEAESLLNLGQLALHEGRTEEAEAMLASCAAIRESVAPESVACAVAWHQLGLVVRAAGRPREALDHLARAADALEAQQGRLGGSGEVRSGFRAHFMDIYHDYIDLLLELGRPEEGFHVLERSRARGLLALLAERDLLFSRDLPPQMARQRARLNAEYDRSLTRLCDPTTVLEDSERQALQAGLAELRQRREDLEARIRSASPRLASLQYPHPVDLEAAKRWLDEDTLLLAWSVGRDKGHLFAVSPRKKGVTAVAIAVDEDTLRHRVRRLRSAVQTGIDAADQDHVRTLATELTKLILPSMSDRISAAERLVLLPDGPLHLLPFAALVNPATGHEWLVEAKPISIAPSATVLAELRQRPARPTATQVVAFGDPAYRPIPQGMETSGPGPAAVGVLELTPLPATRAEVEHLGRLYPQSSRLWLGAEATEERVKGIDASVAIIHLACHGLTDERFPLDSALALAAPGPRSDSRENGLLQAWEIYEDIRIDADLVTLSACETALGKELAGEGLIGLTRAFQFAGARSIVASLWRVADQVTAELVKRFYTHLSTGMSKDQALRHAQLDLIRTPIAVSDDASARLDASHPYCWASFELIGDWR
jgi:CHAT domain-containing protein/Tfp pilus assembly protein PilF